MTDRTNYAYSEGKSPFPGTLLQACFTVYVLFLFKFLVIHLVYWFHFSIVVHFGILLLYVFGLIFYIQSLIFKCCIACDQLIYSYIQNFVYVILGSTWIVRCAWKGRTWGTYRSQGNTYTICRYNDFCEEVHFQILILF